jgi:hypothetical protein
MTPALAKTGIEEVVEINQRKSSSFATLADSLSLSSRLR